MAMTLNRIHCQRLAKAAEAAREGKEVTLAVEGNTAFGVVLVWRDGGQRHVIASGGVTNMNKMLVQAQAVLSGKVRKAEVV